ncbi:MAG: hypothetical protein IPH75_04745 [bacterium]|nr:hypothetical protein [bacterium]
MNPYRILGAAANLFFIILFAIYLSLDTLENSLFPTEVILGGSVLLYGIAISALAICFGLPSAQLRRNGLYGSIGSMLLFSYLALFRQIPMAQQGMMLLSVWSIINILALGFGDEEERISLKERRRLAEQKRKLDRLRGTNPNESDKPAN